MRRLKRGMRRLRLVFQCGCVWTFVGRKGRVVCRLDTLQLHRLVTIAIIAINIITIIVVTIIVPTLRRRGSQSPYSPTAKPGAVKIR